MTLQDAIHAALITQGFTGHVSEMLLAFYKAGGATSNDISTAQHQYLVAQGATSAQVNNMWFEVLRAAGYTGSLNDMLYAFWVAGGSFLGPELMSSFVNGSVFPLDTLVAAGVDISSGIALAETKGCVSNPFFPVANGDQYCLEISALTINAFTGIGLRIVIVGGPTGNAGQLSDQLLITESLLDFKYTFNVTVTDISSYLQLGVAGSSTIDFIALGISLKKVL